MTNVQSKFLPLETTCKEYVHPWTDSCWNSIAGLMMQASVHSVRIYIVVYMLSLLMRGRIPNRRDIKRTILGIIQSSAFLTTNGFTFVMFTCFLRKLFGKFYFLTVAFIPSFLASFTAIFIERPTRRPLLALYVANVATETVWRMAEARGLVKSIPYGQTIIFGISASTLLYLYRLGLHRSYEDSLFDILQFVVGRNEEVILIPREQPLPEVREPDVNLHQQIDQPNQLNVHRVENEQHQGEVEPLNIRENNRISERNNYLHISSVVRMYSSILKRLKMQKRHKSCPHNNSCIYYSLRGGLKLFSVGFVLQFTLKFVLQIPKLIRLKLKRKTILNKDTLKLGIFLGGFSFLYKSISCTLRHIIGFDHPAHAIPAGFIASTAFVHYPDTTVALYVMWKMLQIAYNIGIQKGIVPPVPGFTVLLYCLGTSILFHAGIVEPTNLRASYWKFLYSLSGGRVSIMDRKSFDVWGLESSRGVEEVVKLTQTAVKNVKFAFS